MTRVPAGVWIRRVLRPLLVDVVPDSPLRRGTRPVSPVPTASLLVPNMCDVGGAGLLSRAGCAIAPDRVEARRADGLFPVLIRQTRPASVRGLCTDSAKDVQR